MRASRLCLAGVALIAMTAPAWADFARVADRDRFLGIVQGRELSRLGVGLRVTPGGQITGGALGSDVTGSWEWRNGYFCREGQWGDDEIEPNCQLVEFDGSQIRFTSDQGSGRSVTLGVQ